MSLSDEYKFAISEVLLLNGWNHNLLRVLFEFVARHDSITMHMVLEHELKQAVFYNLKFDITYYEPGGLGCIKPIYIASVCTVDIYDSGPVLIFEGLPDKFIRLTLLHYILKSDSTLLAKGYFSDGLPVHVRISSE